MNFMTQNSMLRLGISDRVSAIIDDLEDLHPDRMEDFLNIKSNKNNKEVSFVKFFFTKFKC